jgi:hypothetical protein
MQSLNFVFAESPSQLLLGFLDSIFELLILGVINLRRRPVSPNNRCPEKRGNLSPTLDTEDELAQKVYSLILQPQIVICWANPGIRLEDRCAGSCSACRVSASRSAGRWAEVLTSRSDRGMLFGG